MTVSISKKEAKPPLRILGIDISTKTGLARVTLTGGSAEHKLLPTLNHKPMPEDGFGQFRRWAKYETQLEEVLCDHQPHFAVIEGYGFASQSLATLVEIGTVLRGALWRRQVPWITVAPTQLKKFVTGKGSGQKNVIMVEAYKRFGIDTKDDNTADAACLAYFGAAACGWYSGLPRPHLDALKDAHKAVFAFLPSA